MTRKFRSLFLACAIMILGFGNFHNQISAQTSSESIVDIFNNPDVDAKGMFRWWFPDAVAGEIDDGEIAAHLQELYKNGFGGVEVAMVVDFTDMDNEAAKIYGWGTPNWVNLMKKVLKSARELPGNFKVDFTISAHWPPSFNTIDPNDEGASGELSYAYTKITGEGVMELPLPVQKTNDGHRRIAADFIFVDRFVAATIGEVKSIDGNNIVLETTSLQDVTKAAKKIMDEVTGLPKFTKAGIPENSTLFGDKEKLNDKQYYWQVDLDESTIGADYKPGKGEELVPGDLILFAYYTRGTGAIMSGGSSFPMADRMYETNYFNRAGARVIIEYWRKYILNDPELVELLKWAYGDIFEDSIESSSSGAFWTWRFLKEFSDYRNYDLTPYLPFVATSKRSSVKFVSSDEMADRIMEDYNLTLNDLYIDNHVKELQNWTREFNYGYRAQAYGASINTSGAATVLDVSEGESLGFGTRYDQFRNIAGGVHMSGKKYISDEVLADIGSAYKINWPHVTNTLNNNFAAGVNRMIIHGTAYKTDYSGKNDDWPGWHPFGAMFADPWGPRQASWDDIETISDFISRNQAVLQNGKPTIDIAVYKYEIGYGIGFPELLANGYSYDIVTTDGILYPGSDVVNKVLAPFGPAYQAMIINDQHSLDMKAVNKLIEYAEAGLPIIIYGQVPQKLFGIPGDEISDLRTTLPTDTDLQAKTQQLISYSNVVQVTDKEQIVPTLTSLGVTAYASYSDKDLRVLGRRDADGTHYYYLFNSGEKTIKLPVSFTGEGTPYRMNTWTGKIEPLAQYQVNSDKLNTELIMTPGESFVIAISNNTEAFGKAPDLHVIKSDTEVDFSGSTMIIRSSQKGTYKTELSNGRTITSVIDNVPDKINLEDWDLAIESWGPGGVESDPTVAKKTNIVIGNTHLITWNKLEVSQNDLENALIDSMGQVSGIGFYTTTFNLDKAWTGGNNAYLMVEHNNDMITAVTVNGKEINILDQSKNQIDLGGYLKQGKNEIQIKLVTTMFNRAKAENEIYSGGRSLFGGGEPMGGSFNDAGEGGLPESPVPGGMPGGFAPPEGMPPGGGFGGPGRGSTADPVYGLTKVEIVPYGQTELQ